MRRWAFDGAVAAGVLLVSFALAPGTAAAQPGTHAVDVWAYLLVAAACVGLVARREYPLPVAALAGTALVVFAVRDYPGGPLVLPVMVALYTVGVRLPRRQALVAGVVAIALVAVWSVAILAGHGQPSAFTWAAPGWVLACLLAGMVVRARRQVAGAVRDRAAQALRTGVIEERLRIARDLHDVIGHSFAAVNVQARAAAALLDRDTESARQALAAIEDASREALREIRATLSTLRAAARPPVLDAAALDALLAPVRAAGLGTHAAADPDLGLPTEVSHVLYRVVQESLTNVLRHARARTVTVTLARDGDAVRVEVRDDGTGAAPGPGGHGLTGMRERVQVLGGRLRAGPDPRGGWRVTARVPLWQAEQP